MSLFSSSGEIMQDESSATTTAWQVPHIHSPRFFDSANGRVVARAKELLDCCISGDRPRLQALVDTNPNWMFVTVATKDIDGNQITISPLRYVIKHHNYHQYQIMCKGARSVTGMFVQQARSQTDFLNVAALTQCYKTYRRYQLQYAAGILSQGELQKIWAVVVGGMQRFKMPREMLQVMCGVTESGDSTWGPHSDFDVPPQFGWIAQGDSKYQNENDYCEWRQEQLGRDFAYYRDENNMVHTHIATGEVCLVNCEAEIASIQHYARLMQAKINASLDRLEAQCNQSFMSHAR